MKNKKTKWEKDQEKADLKAREAERLSRCKVQYFIQQYGDEDESIAGVPDEYPSLLEMLDQWEGCYFLGSLRCFIRYTTSNGWVWEIPIPAIDDHDFELNNMGLDEKEMEALRKVTPFWRKVEPIRAED